MFKDSNGRTQSHRAWQNELGKSFPADNPEQVGLTEAVNTSPGLTLEQLADIQKHRIEGDAQQAMQEPITDSNGITWAGGFDSAIKIKMAIDLTEFRGRPQITLFDTSDEMHDLSLGAARQVAALVGEDYQVKLGMQKAANRALKAIDLNAPDAKAQIEAVTWEAWQ